MNSILAQSTQVIDTMEFYTVNKRKLGITKLTEILYFAIRYDGSLWNNKEMLSVSRKCFWNVCCWQLMMVRCGERCCS